MSITTRELSRTVAAFGTALTLVALPLTLAPTPVHAAPAVAEADAGSAATADSDAGADGASADSGAEADAGSDSGSGTDGTAASGGSADGTTAADGSTASADGTSESDGVIPGPDADSDGAADGGGTDDPRCEDPTTAPDGEPCAAKTVPLRAGWDTDTKQLKLPDGDAGMPESWVGAQFSGPPSRARVPAQSTEAPADSGGESDPGAAGDSPDTDTGADTGAEANGETDDSGNPIDARAPASVPTTFSLNAAGEVIDPATDRPVTFTNFTSDPEWDFEVRDVNGTNTITVTGTPYPDSDGGSTGSNDGSSTAGGGGTSSGGSDGGRSDGGDSSTSSDANSPGDDSGAGSEGSSGSDGSGSRGDSSATADGRTEAGASAEGSANSAANGGDERPSPTPSTGADGADANASSGADGGTGAGDEENTEAPSTGNGQGTDRDVIPGDAGDSWVPGGGSAPHPDYSDPVPRNPDVPTPEDDTDLITGGDQTAPRGNNQPASSFGESLISTIVSSWPVLVLAAFGMAAVGFILFLVGRRNKQQD
ncbi:MULTISPECIES: hypothetical protein [Brevibacterium]|uniref:Uncharacterized protein n=1 Tax=Brevibacterium casei TaxID=33889 RepID=A0A7T3ZYP0_9MICO|nr:hypothetical protein [Brevibacterium casei]QQB14145.1 hypothetical protein I6H47_15470 [Brevibacterium casei]